LSSFVDVGGEFLVVEVDGRIVGMGGIRANGARQAEVLRVRVHPAMRRLGVGRALMNSLEAAAGELGYGELHLDTTVDQPEAIAFYTALGYAEVGRQSFPEWELVFFTKPTRTPEPTDVGFWTASVRLVHQAAEEA
jgi:N-acetylglutamate synthase-like GNAT family acetyltransferase